MEYPVESRKRQRLSVGVGLFLTCMVLTTVVGLFAGLMISNYTHNNYVMYAEKAETAPVQRELVRENATAAPAQNSGESEAKAGAVSAFAENSQFTKAQIVEMSAPSVVGIDTITTATHHHRHHQQLLVRLRPELRGPRQRQRRDPHRGRLYRHLRPCGGRGQVREGHPERRHLL